MIQATAEGWARITLLSCIAAAQLTLLVRGDYASFAIMASLSWLAGAMLLLEREEQASALALDQLPLSRVLPGLLLLWSLLVLSRVARLYDPLLHLLHLLPLASLLGLALLGGLAWRSAGLATLALIGALLPAQVLINRLLPTAHLASLTAWASSLLLWVLGRPAFAEGRRIVLSEQTLVVDASCTAVNTMALCLAAAVVLVILLPPPARPPFLRRSPSIAAGLVLGPIAVLIAFVVNLVRIVLLSYTDFSPGLEGLAEWRSFGFWHEGLGSNLFSLAAMALVCMSWVLVLELNLRSTRLVQGKRP